MWSLFLPGWGATSTRRTKKKRWIKFSDFKSEGEMKLHEALKLSIQSVRSWAEASFALLLHQVDNRWLWSDSVYLKMTFPKCFIYFAIKKSTICPLCSEPMNHLTNQPHGPAGSQDFRHQIRHQHKPGNAIHKNVPRLLDTRIKASAQRDTSLLRKCVWSFKEGKISGIVFRLDELLVQTTV